MKMILPVILFVTIIFSFIGFGHFVVYKSLLMVFDITNLRLIKILKIFLGIGALSFITFTLLTQIGYSKIGSFFYKTSAIWLGTLYFLFLASVIILIIFSISYFLGWTFVIARSIGIILFIGAIVLSAYGVFNSFNVRVTKYTVAINNLPEEWINKDIVMFSDTHFGSVRNLAFAKRLVNKINGENPAMVIIAGDYYDGPPTNSKEVASSLSGLVTEKGTYFAPGNHEDYGNISEFSSALIDAGVTVLSNNSVEVDGLQIVGIDYQTGSNKEQLTSVLKSLTLSENKPKILIKHAPNNLSEVDNLGYDLVLSGHVHNGQVWPGPWLARKIFKEFSYGLNYLNDMPVITSSGAGTWGPPQRVGTKSEIVLIHLENN